MKKKRILIISASAGQGHVRAGNALLEAAHAFFSDSVEIDHIDMLEHVTPALRRTFTDGYTRLIKTFPRVWEFIYKTADTTTFSEQFYAVTQPISRAGSKQFLQYIVDYKPDYIICTHSFPAQTIQHSKIEAIDHIPLSIVVTDYALHHFWIVPQVSHYFVATEKMKWDLIRQDVSEPRIHISGIPIAPSFLAPINKTALQKKHSIIPGQPVILLLSGGEGLIHTDEIVEELKDVSFPCTLIAVAGKNTRLEKKLRKMSLPPHINYIPLGWTDDMHELMHLTDIVVSKPGGLTVSECIALEKPIISITPIPGQEEYNAEYILENNFGSVAHNPNDILYYIEHYLGQKKKRATPAQYIAAKEILITLLTESK